MMTDEFEPVLNDFKMAFKTALGRFYPDFEYGSGFYNGGCGSDFLLCCANQAAGFIDGLFVKKINMTDNKCFTADLLINEAEGQVLMNIEAYT